MNQKYEKAKFSDVFKYSFGGLGSNLAFFLVMSFLTFFYTDIFGISSYVVATLMLISRFIDAFTDPIMGMLGDNTRSKMGKYRPWIIFGAPVLGVLIFLLFTAPEMSPTMKVVYAYVIYILYSLASTVVNIPYHALTPVLSEDPQQRTEIVAWKQGMGTVSQFVITILALPLVELFGGGKGTLELVEDEDILECGIRIIAQPPGKKLQNMMQMSGGEKSLTAISLLFAIQNLKPSPFCLLDEIEAALDDSNVTRFAQYLHKLTKNTQFIVITHRRGTMNAADRLYGITMQEKGVSTLVSVNLIENQLDE